MGAPNEGRAMNPAPITPQALHGYPVDRRLPSAHRAQRGQRRSFATLRALAARLRRGAQR
jgi:hypothetical protein